MATEQLHFASGAAQFFSEKFNECLIGGGVHGRRGDFDFQFIAERFADCVFGSARLELHGKQSAASGFFQKARGRHLGGERLKLFIFGIDELERQRGHDGRSEIADEIKPEIRFGSQAHHGDTDGNGGIERAAGNTAERKGHRRDREADREAVIGIARRGFRRSDVQNDVAKRERADEFRDERVADIRVASRESGTAFKLQREQSGGRSPKHLRDEIKRHIAGAAAPAQPDRNGDCRIVVTARDVSARIDHDHQRCTDGERRQIAGAGIDDRHADGQNEKESADEFNEILFHVGESLIRASLDFNFVYGKSTAWCLRIFIPKRPLRSGSLPNKTAVW